MRRTEFELCHGEKGYHEMERFSPSYIYRGENVCGYITFSSFACKLHTP